ncbi:MAG: nickel-dependent lactate racemase [Candidatus Adiutrix sp.]|jgi:nickel-dependent lactate racemase|nr:nickel-dependent lactate racemase [Candidatus Adiutrix sp.]
MRGLTTREIKIPYGNRRLSCFLEAERAVNILRPAAAPAGAARPEIEIIAEALAAPIASPPLAELARGKKNVVVLTSDHTRPVPSRLTLPPMLAEIRRASPEARITVLIGVGSHRASTREEMAEKFGADFVAREHVINHDPHDAANLVSLGRLPSGGELVLNRLAVEADLLAADGFIEPHQFAGFSGGRKSVLPGIAGLGTVLASHNAEFTVHPQARPGSLEGNPFQTDMVEAARRAKLAFILNVTLSHDKRVSAAFAGDMEEAHLAGCRRVLAGCGVRAAPAPIVITSNGGYPLDRNIYQATKSIMAADLTTAPGGVIIAVNECRDGHGAEGFYRTFREAASPGELLAAIGKRGREETLPDQWVTQLTASILARRTVFMVSEAPREQVEAFGLKPAPGLQEALALAEKAVGDSRAAVTVLPDAVALVIE